MGIDQKKSQDILHKLRCAVCCSGEIYSEPYEYKQVEKIILFRSLRSRDNFSKTIKVHTCEKCRNQFRRWKIYNLSSNVIFLLGLTCVVLGIFFLIFHQVMGDRGIPLIIIGFLLVAYTLTLRYIIGKISSNPSNYFFYDFSNNMFYIKPEGEIEWMLYSQWLTNILGEKI